MALITILGGSTFGALGGILGWLLFGMSMGTALVFYLACGVLLPIALLVIAVIAPLRRARLSPAPATEMMRA